MSLKKRSLMGIFFISSLFLFLVAWFSNSQASLIDVIRPAQADSQSTNQIQSNLPVTEISLSDPEDIVISEKFGRIREIFRGNNSKIIINIQDAHCNFEAQTNISHILDSLNERYGLRLVALEGSSGEIDPSIFTTFPDEDVREEVATYFLKKGKINGAEFLSITSKNPPMLFGVETKEYYLANLAAFTNTIEDREVAKTACAIVKTVLDELKDSIYGKDLKVLDEKITNFKKGTDDLAGFADYLRKIALSKKVPFKNRFLNLEFLCRTVDMEKTIDFNKVERERSKVITVLEKSLNKDELNTLFEKSLSFKSGQISASRYHIYLRAITQEKGAKFNKYKNLALYTDYLVLYDKINSQRLFEEISELSDAVKEKLFKNKDQRALDKLSRNIRLLEGMFDISMSRADVDYYKRNKADFKSSVFIDFIKKRARKYRIAYDWDPNFSLIDKHLPDFEHFYRIADTRDDALIENTIKKMEEEKLQAAALITGGYHTEGIAERLRKRGISYVIIAPRITQVDKDSPYLEILSGGKVSFEDMFTKEEDR